MFTCADCTVERHAVLPFHALDRWDGEYLSPCSLSELEFVYHLGHEGSPCERGRRPESHKPLRIMHTNGIHTMNVVYCGCRVASEHQQLLTQGIFPATDKMPETGFTFQTLDQFLRLNVVAKISALDYCQTMRCATDDVRPHSSPVSV